MSLKQVRHSTNTFSAPAQCHKWESVLTLQLQEIETWVAALARYDNNEFDDSLEEFARIGDTSKILFNIGVIHATLGEHEKAVSRLGRSFLPTPQSAMQSLDGKIIKTNIATNRSRATNAPSD